MRPFNINDLAEKTEFSSNMTVKDTFFFKKGVIVYLF